MKDMIKIKGSISKIKMHSQELKDEISTIKEKDVSVQYYVGNLRRLSLQALDLFNAMERQVAILNINKNYLAVKANQGMKRS